MSRNEMDYIGEITGGNVGGPILETYLQKIGDRQLSLEKAIGQVTKKLERARNQHREIKSRINGIEYVLRNLQERSAIEELQARIRQGIPKEVSEIHSRCLELGTEAARDDLTVARNREVVAEYDRACALLQKTCDHRFLARLRVYREDTYGKRLKPGETFCCLVCFRSLGDKPENGDQISFDMERKDYERLVLNSELPIPELIEILVWSVR